MWSLSSILAAAAIFGTAVMAQDPPAADQACTCQASGRSPGISNVQGAVNYFRSLNQQCGSDGGCAEMYRADGIRVYSCGQGSQNCDNVANQLDTLIKTCVGQVGNEARVGGACWVGQVNSGAFISLSQ